MLNEERNPWVASERRSNGDSVFDVLDTISDRLTSIERRLDGIEHGMDATASAFVVNDIGRPDFDGHRKSHLQMLKTAAQMDSYKNEGAKKVIAIVVLALAGIFVLGLTSWMRGNAP